MRALVRREKEIRKYAENLLAVSRAAGILGATEVAIAEEALEAVLAG